MKLLTTLLLLCSLGAGAATRDSLPGIIIYPNLAGDSYPVIQGALNYQSSHPGYKIYLATGGLYFISQPLMIVNLKPAGDDYNQAYAEIEGASNAKNAPGPYCSQIRTMFADKPALIIQQGKGVRIARILFTGMYTKSQYFSQLQIDTTSALGWQDGICSFGRTNPHAGIAIDPFGARGSFDSAHPMYKGLEQYYLPQMGRGGSTGIIIEQCAFTNFVAGIVITPSFQANGEEIVFRDCRVDNCYSAYAWTQAQSKANIIENMQVWGGCRTILDGGSFGFRHSDGATAPMVNVMNIAGSNYQLMACYQNAFPAKLTNVYAESLFRLGEFGGHTYIQFDGLQCDLQYSAPNTPTPGFIFWGTGVHFTHSMIRVYGGNNSRIILNGGGLGDSIYFDGGSLPAIPVVIGSNVAFSHTQLYYQNIPGTRNGFITGDMSRYEWYGRVSDLPVHRDPWFNGYVVIPAGAAKVDSGDLLLTVVTAETGDGIRPIPYYPLGYVNHVSGDTAYLDHMGVDIVDGQTYTISFDRPIANTPDAVRYLLPNAGNGIRDVINDSPMPLPTLHKFGTIKLRALPTKLAGTKKPH